VMHRIGAWTLLGLALVQAVAALGGPGPVRRRSLVLLALVVAQGAVGVLNVLFLLPVEVTLLHSLGANLTALATASLHHEVWRAPLPTRDVSPGGAPAARDAGMVAPEVA